MKDAYIILSFISFCILSVLAIICILAPNSFVLKWAKLQEKRRSYGFAFYFGLASAIFLSSTFLDRFVWAVALFFLLCVYMTYSMWKVLYSGTVPQKSKSQKKTMTMPPSPKPEKKQSSDVSPTEINPLVKEIEENWTQEHTRLCAEKFLFVPSTAVEDVIREQTNELSAALGEEFRTNPEAWHAVEKKVRAAYILTRNKNLPRTNVTQPQTSSRITKVKIGSNNNLFNIPSDVSELLWFSDGPLKNYAPEDVGREQDVGYGFSIKFFMTTDIEPSLISTKLPVCEPKERWLVPPLGYFPTYSRLNEEQMWVYWNWLHNIEHATDIGNVFIFYYGLERHLFLNSYKNAFDMVIRLKKSHVNNSFQRYSSNALLASIIYHKDWALYDKLQDVENELEENRLSDFHIFVRFFMNKPLNSLEIMSISANFGFKNRRYINDYPDLFNEILNFKIQEKFGKQYIPFDIVDINKCPIIPTDITANLSLAPNQVNISKITEHKKYKSVAFELLDSTHQTLKIKLREMRKDGLI